MTLTRLSAGSAFADSSSGRHSCGAGEGNGTGKGIVLGFIGKAKGYATAKGTRACDGLRVRGGLGDGTADAAQQLLIVGLRAAARDFLGLGFEVYGKATSAGTATAANAAPASATATPWATRRFQRRSLRRHRITHYKHGSNARGGSGEIGATTGLAYSTATATGKTFHRAIPSALASTPASTAALFPLALRTTQRLRRLRQHVAAVIDTGKAVGTANTIAGSVTSTSTVHGYGILGRYNPFVHHPVLRNRKRRPPQAPSIKPLADTGQGHQHHRNRERHCLRRRPAGQGITLTRRASRISIPMLATAHGRSADCGCQDHRPRYWHRLCQGYRRRQRHQG